MVEHGPKGWKFYSPPRLNCGKVTFLPTSLQHFFRARKIKRKNNTCPTLKHGPLDMLVSFRLAQIDFYFRTHEPLILQKSEQIKIFTWHKYYWVCFSRSRLEHSIHRINVFNEIIRVALLPMSIGKSATINWPANVTVSLLPVALLPVHIKIYATAFKYTLNIL